MALGSAAWVATGVALIVASVIVVCHHRGTRTPTGARAAPS